MKSTMSSNIKKEDELEDGWLGSYEEDFDEDEDEDSDDDDAEPDEY